MITKDVSIHRENVTVDCEDDAVNSVFSIIAMDSVDIVTAAISSHSAEVNKLTVVFPNLNNVGRVNWTRCQIKAETHNARRCDPRRESAK